ncbi:uncharacterized protein [Panulirus ornatus]|uniref:uncharacterized protein isoform X2 n=1 Tax=Panulirus ornatus TaxID=150431 RepID=UPI003A8722AF
MMYAGAVMVSGAEMWALLLLWAVLLVGVTHPASVNLKSLKVKVPRVAYVGEDTELECTFPWTDPGSLYSIKWWRDNDQFYQYIPKKKDPKMKFNVTGIKVDPQNSTEFKVSLKDLTLTSSGMFTCEVISDDNFETFRESANMTVIDPPDLNRAGKFGPTIEVAGWNGDGPVEVRDGDHVEAVCVARGSNPPVLLTWFINDTKAPKEFVRQQTSHMEGHNTYTSSLRVVLPAQELWDSQGRLHLRCSAEISGLFRESDVLELHNPELRKAQLSGLFAAGQTVAASPRLLACVLMLAWLLHHCVLTHAPSCS